MRKCAINLRRYELQTWKPASKPLNIVVHKITCAPNITIPNPNLKVKWNPIDPIKLGN